MVIKQISVYLENKSGQLLDFVNLLADNNIDIQAMSIADTQDYGILRVIVEDADSTIKLLRDNNYSAAQTDVLAIDIPDQPGSMRNVLKVLNDNNISLGYSYAFMTRASGKACIVIRVDDNAAAEKLLKESGALA